MLSLLVDRGFVVEPMPILPVRDDGVRFVILLAAVGLAGVTVFAVFLLDLLRRQRLSPGNRPPHRPPPGSLR